MTEERGGPTAEINAMKSVAEALEVLDKGAVARVLNWAVARYQEGSASLHQVAPQDSASCEPAEVAAENEFGDIGSFVSACNPVAQSEYVLAAAYWLQEVNGHDELNSQTINTELKHLGHGVKNITQCLTDLKNKKPQLVIQLRKSGSSQQARKKYKVTKAGIAETKTMLTRAVPS